MWGRWSPALRILGVWPDHGRALDPAVQRILAFDFVGIDLEGNAPMTGHANGLITLDIKEADDAHREKIRVQMREPYRTLLGREPGVTLIVVLLTLKTLELRARRDAFVVFFLSFFLLLTNFFYSQSLSTAVGILLALWGLLTALIMVQTVGIAKNSQHVCTSASKRQAPFCSGDAGLSLLLLLALIALSGVFTPVIAKYEK